MAKNQKAFKRFFSALFQRWFQFGRTNIVYIFNGQLLTMCNDVTISNIKLLINFKYLP